MIHSRIPGIATVDSGLECLDPVHSAGRAPEEELHDSGGWSLGPGDR